MKRILSAMVVVAVTSAGTFAAGPDTKYKAPRTGDGRPNLQGVWSFASAVPLQRPAKFAGKKTFTKEEFDARRQATLNTISTIAKLMPVESTSLLFVDDKIYVEDLRTSLITYPETGRLPALVDGVQRALDIEDILEALQGGGPGLANLAAAFGGGGKKESYKDFGTSDRCLDGLTVPLLPQFGASAVGHDEYMQIIQSADQVALVWDYGRRVVAIDSKPATFGAMRTSTGTSRGHWEGDTLVVDTRNFSERIPGFAGAGRSRDKVVTERFTRTAASLEYSATVVDPSTFTDRIGLSFPMALVNVGIYEAACHEGNYSLANALSAARAAEQQP
jgi:hypothetical protein